MLQIDRTWRADAEPALSYLPSGRARMLAILPVLAVALALVPGLAAWRVAHAATPLLSAIAAPLLTWTSVTALVLLFAGRENLRRRILVRAVASAIARARSVGLDELATVPDGTLVRVRGRVRASSGLSDQPLVVARRDVRLRPLRSSAYAQVRERIGAFRLAAAGREAELALEGASLAPLPHAPSWQLRQDEELDVIGTKVTLAQALGEGPYRGTASRIGLAAPDARRPLLLVPVAPAATVRKVTSVPRPARRPRVATRR